MLLYLYRDALDIKWPRVVLFLLIPNTHWEHFSMGFFPNLLGQHGFHCIFVKTDRFLKEVHIIPCMNSIDASYVATFFSKEVFHLNGVFGSFTSYCDEHFVCCWRILRKLLTCKLHFFSAFYSKVDRYTEIMNIFLGNLLRSLEGEHPRKWEFVISQDAKPPFEVVHGRNLIHVVILLQFSNEVKV